MRRVPVQELPRYQRRIRLRLAWPHRFSYHHHRPFWNQHRPSYQRRNRQRPVQGPPRWYQTKIHPQQVLVQRYQLRPEQVPARRRRIHLQALELEQHRIP